MFGSASSDGVNATNGFGVHSIAIKVPKSDLTRNGMTPTNPASSERRGRRLGGREPPPRRGPRARAAS